MAYSAQLVNGNYEISQDGQRIATGSAAVLGNYGLSTTQLSTPAPTASNPTPQTAPTAIGTQTTPQAQATAKPAIGANVYASQRQQVQNGSITVAQAQSNIQALVSGGQFSDTSVNMDSLFPAGTTLPKGSSYVNGQGQTVTYDSTGTPQISPSPTISTIPTTTTPPTTTGSFTSPGGKAPQTFSDYTNSVQATLDAQNATLKATNDAQIAQYQQKIDALNKQQNDFQTLQENNLLSENSTIGQETAQKTLALQQEQQQYTDNYNAIQTLAGRASALVDTATALTDQMRNTTGLASIMNPRISQTAADLTAELAVIKGAVDIYSGQIGAAQNQLKSATDAITSIYSDQLNYYKAVNDFYTTAENQDQTQITQLTTDQKTYIASNMKMLQDKIDSTRTTADYIAKASVDPSTALTFAKAGVTLTDTIPQIQAKLATQIQSQTAIANNDAMTKAGYSTTPIVGAKTEAITDQYGKTWYKSIPTTQSDTAPTTATEGSDLADSKTFLTANPNVSPQDAKQAFLAKHPSSSSAWDNYWGVSSANPDGNYPQPPATDTGGGWWNTVKNVAKAVFTPSI